MASALAARWTALYVLFPVFRSGKMNTEAWPATGLVGASFGHFGIDGRVILDGAIKEELGSPFMRKLGRFDDFVNGFALAGRTGGVGQHGDAGFDAEDTGGMRRADGDVRKLAGCGVRIDRAVRPNTRMRSLST